MHPLLALKAATVCPLSPPPGPPLPASGGPGCAGAAASCIPASLCAGMLGLVNLINQKTSLLSLLFNPLLFSYLHSQCSEQQAHQDGLTRAPTHFYFSPSKPQVTGCFTGAAHPLCNLQKPLVPISIPVSCPSASLPWQAGHRGAEDAQAGWEPGSWSPSR